MTYDAIQLPEIIYEPSARNGRWCCAPYKGHPHGCPNFHKGCTNRPALTELTTDYNIWYAVVEEFDLKTHASKMKVKFPQWSERQCRNPLYWQGTVRKNLKLKAARLQDYMEYSKGSRGILLDIPEANGMNVFETMRRAGINLEMHPDIVRKVMIVGING